MKTNKFLPFDQLVKRNNSIILSISLAQVIMQSWFCLSSFHHLRATNSGRALFVSNKANNENLTFNYAMPARKVSRCWWKESEWEGNSCGEISRNTSLETVANVLLLRRNRRRCFTRSFSIQMNLRSVIRLSSTTTRTSQRDLLFCECFLFFQERLCWFKIIFKATASGMSNEEALFVKCGAKDHKLESNA